MSSWLAGKRALVVGGGSGIGRGVVAAFRAEGAAVGVLELDRAKCASLTEADPDLLVVEGDATTAAANQRAVTESVDAFGGLDVLVSCVGIFDFYRQLEDISDDELGPAFDEIFSVNVLSYLRSAKAAIPALRASGGNIVLTESTSAYAAGRGGTLYVASKFATRGLVTTLAHELAPDIRVNGVAPGGTLNTDLRGLTSFGLQETRLSGPDRARELAARTPLHVALGPEDHAWGYVFLASDRARGITGRVVHSDGGTGVGQ
ncbi:phthalate 3,4-dihydrodiol dehydrogenase [Antricoccus suffuscus]|uniref:Phthalate 3,4-dihydrodiol dehydrogenase n=1 Tax=Antricoccus suffuscus TaxID=1629062 RepID=A0A2T0ZYZ5_9ACTN|nr:3-(cis-5,6-dihydroxycyclohexa-1,3-dien-1-yl)propanoate dehydrogenase [Antricoccus suffuscus]PRZ41571.1 phthalate 3,4-dihydrodiol dehydrogenase [Antricoccus suffuscus]